MATTTRHRQRMAHPISALRKTRSFTKFAELRELDMDWAPWQWRAVPPEPAPDEDKLFPKLEGLVFWAARSYRRLCRAHRLLDYEDAIQEGYFGLLYAMRTHDRTRGAKMSSWAATCIRRFIHHGFRHLMNGPKAWNLESWRRHWVLRHRSLDRVVGLGEHMTPFHELLSMDVPDPLAEAEQRDLASRFDREIDALKPLWQKCVRIRLCGATLEQVGRAVGRTRERVRQIQVVAMRTIDRRMARRGIDAFDACKAHIAQTGGWDFRYRPRTTNEDTA